MQDADPPIVVAVDGDPLRVGRIYVAPPDHHPGMPANAIGAVAVDLVGTVAQLAERVVELTGAAIPPAPTAAA